MRNARFNRAMPSAIWARDLSLYLLKATVSRNPPGSACGAMSLPWPSSYSEPLSPKPNSLLSGKYTGNSAFLRPIQALDQRKAREITALFERIPYSSEQGILIC